MNKREEGMEYIEEMKRIIIKEKGECFWQKISETLERGERKNFIEGYKYAITILEDGLGKDR